MAELSRVARPALAWKFVNGITLILNDGLFCNQHHPKWKCWKCLQLYPAIAFLKHAVQQESGHVLLSGDRACHRCDPPLPFVKHLRDGDLAMRVRLVNAAGEEAMLRDVSTQREQPISERGLRWFKAKDEIRLQPYEDRNRRRRTS